ncbi:large ribosomal subunit protein uL30m [Prorops nasuta]|uniref:large ribosomal subunit protein uL30m n=1 Tax=Prorops nasuta TaxID=863751 RepID=UPI0034CF9872
MREMLIRQSIQLNIYRYASRAVPLEWAGQGERYGFITYYPRFPGQKDPPIKPSKLFLVQRIKTMKGNPYWENNTLKELGIKETGFQPVVVKNTPDVCSRLWNVKHLVKITPIDLPDRLPEPEDPVDTYLHENGKLYVVPKVQKEVEDATIEFKNDPKRMEKWRMAEFLRLRWLNGQSL